MMKPEIKAKWLKALRGKKYQQARECFVEHNGIERKAHCCLAVLVDVIDPEGWDGGFHRLSEKGGISDSCRRKVRMTKKQEDELIDMNDSQGKSFRQIANWVRDNL